jgi:anti-sigma factor RsiW
MTMSHRAACADPDLLSAYLDGELAAAEEREVAKHLAACAGCRAELEGLRAVVRHLHGLQRATPPPVLAETVARRVALESPPRGLLARLEAAMRRLPVEPATLLAFGVVVALAAILALFLAGLEESERPPAFQEDGVELQVVSVVVGGRTFDRDGALWRERGTAEPERTLAAGAPEAEALLAETPRLRRLIASSEGIVLRAADGRTVLIEP